MASIRFGGMVLHAEFLKFEDDEAETMTKIPVQAILINDLSDDSLLQAAEMIRNLKVQLVAQLAQETVSDASNVDTRQAQ